MDGELAGGFLRAVGKLLGCFSRAVVKVPGWFFTAVVPGCVEPELALPATAAVKWIIYIMLIFCVFVKKMLFYHKFKIKKSMN